MNLKCLARVTRYLLNIPEKGVMHDIQGMQDFYEFVWRKRTHPAYSICGLGKDVCNGIWVSDTEERLTLLVTCTGPCGLKARITYDGKVTYTQRPFECW